MGKITIPYNTFSSVDWEDLQDRLQLGAVEFIYIKVEDGSIRTAHGTRDLSYHTVDWDLLPMNIKTPPDHVLTYVDLDKNAWRCFVKSNLIWYSEEIDIDD